ncbi:hypothetical protein B0T21DRAFT_302864, partial [Apiosordaria backusii]
MRRLREHRKRYASFMQAYRSGKVLHWDDDVDEPEKWRDLKLPLDGKWPGHQKDKYYNYKASQSEFRKWSVKSMADTEKPDKEVKDALDSLPLLIDTPQVQLGFRKLLGWGGLGLATLYTLQDTKGRTRDVVVKYSIPGASGSGGDLTAEKGFHRYLARARHITQRVWLEKPEKKKKATPASSTGPTQFISKQTGRPVGGGLISKQTGLISKQTGRPVRGIAVNVASRSTSAQAPPDDTDDSTDTDDGTGAAGGPVEPLKRWNVPNDRTYRRSAAKRIDEHNATLILEVMKRGSLENWIVRMCTSGKLFPEKVLWLVFDCLFKAVLAMAYPPRMRPELYDTTNRHKGRFPIKEVIPKTEDEMSPDLIHFDIDASNVLVGDFDFKDTDFTHTLIPILKLADFGLAKFMRNSKATDPMDMHAHRAVGKVYSGYLYPEQFHAEWDYMHAYLPSEETNPDHISAVAGEYSYRSHIYQIGLIMWSMITLRKFALYPFPYSCFEKDVVDPKTGQAVVKQNWGYGGYLQDRMWEKYYDPDLLELVTACMLEEPNERPTLQDLKWRIDSKVQADWDHQRNADVREWCWNFFNEPNTPMPVVPIVPVANPAPVPVPPQPAAPPPAPQAPPPAPPPAPQPAAQPAPQPPPAPVPQPPAVPPPQPSAVPPPQPSAVPPQQPAAPAAPQPGALPPSAAPGRRLQRRLPGAPPIDPNTPRIKLKRKAATPLQENPRPHGHGPATYIP